VHNIGEVTLIQILVMALVQIPGCQHSRLHFGSPSTEVWERLSTGFDVSCMTSGLRFRPANWKIRGISCGSKWVALNNDWMELC
jgi:hypothetical protein